MKTTVFINAHPIFGINFELELATPVKVTFTGVASSNSNQSAFDFLISLIGHINQFQ